MLNGLTDGAALFLESIERVRKILPADTNPDDLELFQAIHEAVYYRVYGKKLNPWWKFW